MQIIINKKSKICILLFTFSENFIDFALNNQTKCYKKSFHVLRYKSLIGILAHHQKVLSIGSNLIIKIQTGRKWTLG